MNTEPMNFAAVATPWPGRLFRLARPGRAKCGPDGRPVSLAAVALWVDGVAHCLLEAGVPSPLAVDYVCLLGQKPDGLDEIADFYAARRPDDLADAELPTFEEMLNAAGGGRIRFTVYHMLTIDHQDLSSTQIEAIRTLLRQLLSDGHTVLVGCSLGATRTGAVIADMEWAMNRA